MEKVPQGVIIAGIGGIALIAFVALRSQSNSTSTVADPNATAAINGIVASNAQAQTLQAGQHTNAVNQGVALETTLLQDTLASKALDLSAKQQSQSDYYSAWTTSNADELSYAGTVDNNKTALEEANLAASTLTQNNIITTGANVQEATLAESLGLAQTSAAEKLGVAQTSAAASVAQAQIAAQAAASKQALGVAKDISNNSVTTAKIQSSPGLGSILTSIAGAVSSISSGFNLGSLFKPAASAGAVASAATPGTVLA